MECKTGAVLRLLKATNTEMMKDPQAPSGREAAVFLLSGLGNFCTQHTILHKRKGVFTRETLPCGQGLAPWFEEAGGTALQYMQEASSAGSEIPYS